MHFRPRNLKRQPYSPRFRPTRAWQPLRTWQFEFSLVLDPIILLVLLTLGSGLKLIVLSLFIRLWTPITYPLQRLP